MVRFLRNDLRNNHPMARIKQTHGNRPRRRTGSWKRYRPNTVDMRDTAAEQVFEGYCTECEEVTDTVYADHSASFCCCDCRFERRHGTVSNQWKEWCRRCQKTTDTIKLDTYQPPSYCCLVCRGDRDGKEGKREWCKECQRRTRTIEIDGETDQEEVDTIEEEDEEEDSSDEEGT
jgi:hypothetical protein